MCSRIHAEYGLCILQSKIIASGMHYTECKITIGKTPTDRVGLSCCGSCELEHQFDNHKICFS